MTNSDRERRIFLSHPHTNNGLFFSLTIKYLFLYWKKTWKRLPENPGYAEMRHGDVILLLQWRHGSTCGQRVDYVRLFVFYLSLGLVRVCEIELSHMGKNSGNLDLVCEKKVIVCFISFLYPYLYLFRRCYINKYVIFHVKRVRAWCCVCGPYHDVFVML